ncbi:MAG: caspase family protein [Marinobacter sp.]|nr:caspase family protein [Marinobacter sp.]
MTLNYSKNVITDIKVIDDAVYLNKSPRAYEAKKQISDFVEKHKNTDIEELIFYFSGHGSRSEEDFFYVMSDFKESKKESTGLRNTELDGLIRTLKPKLTVKIIDACFSGTQYIKSDTNTRIDF